MPIQPRQHQDVGATPPPPLMIPPTKKHTRHTLEALPDLAKLACLGALYWPVCLLTWKGDLVDVGLLTIICVPPCILVAQDIRGVVHNLRVFPREVTRYNELRDAADRRRWARERHYERR
jgi:hypothetical protein